MQPLEALEDETWEQYQEGDLDAAQALTRMLPAYQALQAAAAALEARREALRGQIATLHQALGGKPLALLGYEVRWQEPGTVLTYNAHTLDALVVTLMAQEQYALAEQITAARRESVRAGGLRIARLPAPTPPAVVLDAGDPIISTAQPRGGLASREGAA